ncbi:N-acetylglucosamine kinase-like BadF-type ATPase [Epilithonimonas hungarica]|jgi:Predicted N-acetylglucosamine kinase|uniref:BadF/BadG/BcrA/BcrD ATPase family protein n=1 Tax=Epilithonimonas hungarica TaxID=454006 RepID=UPI00277FB3C1|nr:BadF/BadG/BcrA/BcrD ATPase family protein [Epilithonimonas hungarica]MDP9956750.1 N-acetylglucosamine kinase-like BadF-type ATPase [Epilithonimonas hungarica]
MIAIVDGGSTKCDWVILENDGTEVLKTETVGFNPNIIKPELITIEIEKNQALTKFKDYLENIFFYGSGCGTPENKLIVEREIQKVFTNAQIRVKEDLLAAAYAAYRGVPAIVCILGTGSNACYFDGENVKTELPSLGFLIGDEGSGSALGKQLVRHYFMKKLPPDLHQQFTEIYQLNIDELLKNMYHNPRANAYMADFTRFIVDRKTHPYFQNFIYKELKNFLEFQVMPYEECRESEINFIGSIAYFFEDSLRAAASDFHFRIGTVVQRPIESLVNYHRDYIIPKL